MKFSVTVGWYLAGIRQVGKDRTIELEADSQKQALDEYYSRPDFNPEWRILEVKENAQNGAYKNGTVRTKTSAT